MDWHGEVIYNVLFHSGEKSRDSLYDEGVDDGSDVYNDEEGDLTWLVDREIRVMSELDHPHIVHLDEVYEDKDTACFVMELAKGGEVFDRLVEKEYFDELSASNLVVQVLSGNYRRKMTTHKLQK